jgi:AIR synthase-related protein
MRSATPKTVAEKTAIEALASRLRETRGIHHKLDIQIARQFLCADERAILLGDDCAAIPDGDGHLLFAIEGLLGEFVTAEPWFAGYCAVMVNVSDVYSMGGRPIAMVDALWASDGTRRDEIFRGMSAAAAKYAVPIVGGHTNARSNNENLAAAILGRGGKRLLTSFDARPDDVLIAAIDLRGEWFGSYPYWNASTSAQGARLLADLEVLPMLAEAGLCAAAKDISMGGLVGTATMLCECSDVGATIDLSAIPRPVQTPMEKWLRSFPSYGFLLAVAAKNVSSVLDRFAARDIAASVAGSCNDSGVVSLTDDSRAFAEFWNVRDNPFIGFGPANELPAHAPEKGKR